MNKYLTCDILGKLEFEFNTHYEGIFADGDIAHLHKAEAIAGICDWIEETPVDIFVSDVLLPTTATSAFADDIKQMKEYLVVAGHLNSPVTPKPRKRDSCGEVKL